MNGSSSVVRSSSLTMVQGGVSLPPFAQTFVDAVNRQVAREDITHEHARVLLDRHGLGEHLIGMDAWESRKHDAVWRESSVICQGHAFLLGTRSFSSRSRLFDAIKAGHAVGISGDIYEITWLDETTVRTIDLRPYGAVPTRHLGTWPDNALSIRKLTPVETDAYWTARERFAA